MKTLATAETPTTSKKTTATSGSQTTSKKNTATSGFQTTSKKNTATSGSQTTSKKTAATSGSQTTSKKTTATSGSQTTSKKTTATTGSQTTSKKTTATSGSQTTSKKTTATSRPQTTKLLTSRNARKTTSPTTARKNLVTSVPPKQVTTVNVTTAPLPNPGTQAAGISPTTAPVSNVRSLPSVTNNSSDHLSNRVTVSTEISPTAGHLPNISTVATSIKTTAAPLLILTTTAWPPAARVSSTPAVIVNGNISSAPHASVSMTGVSPTRRTVFNSTLSVPLTSHTSTAATSSNISSLATTLRPLTGANVSQRKFTLKFSLNDTFTADLLDSSSARYRKLQETITSELDKMYSGRFQKSFFRSTVTGFSNGSIVTEVDLLFKGGKEEPVSRSPVLQVLHGALANSSGSSFPLRIILASIHVFEEMSVSINLSLALSSALVLDSSSPSYKEISAALYSWVVFDACCHPCDNLSLSFSDAHGWVDVFLHYQFKTETPVSDDIITAAILNSRSPFLHLKHLLSVNGFWMQVDSFPLSVRITSLNFSEELSKRGSEPFQLYSKHIRTSVERLYKNSVGFIDVYVTNMTAGSLVAHLVMVFERNTSSTFSISKVLQWGLPQLEADGLTVDPASLGIVPTSSVSPMPWSFPAYAVGILVTCGLVLLLGAVAVLAGVKTRRCRRVRTALLRSSRGYDVAAVHSRI
ncbi:uncharacterized protein LOC111843069 [Arapaima gigas]